MSDPEHREMEDTDSELPRNEARMEDVLWGTGAGAWPEDRVDILRWEKVDMGLISSSWSSAIPDIEAPVLSLLRLEAELWLWKEEKPPLCVLCEDQPLSRLVMEALQGPTSIGEPTEEPGVAGA